MYRDLYENGGGADHRKPRLVGRGVGWRWHNLVGLFDRIFIFIQSVLELCAGGTNKTPPGSGTQN